MYSQRQSSKVNRGWKERRSGIEEGRKEREEKGKKRWKEGDRRKNGE